MSQNTGGRYPINAGEVGSGPSWSNPLNARADDGANTVVTVNVTNGLRSRTLYTADFQLLAEDGGPIPAGASIIRVDAAFEVVISVTDSVLANQASLLYRMDRVNMPIVAQATRTQADNTNSGTIVLTLTTGGTQAAPQTVFSRADLGHGMSNGMLRLVAELSLPTGALNAATCSLDFMRVSVEWILYLDARGGAASQGVVGASGTAVATARPSGAVSSASPGGRGAAVASGRAGAVSPARGGAAAKPMLSTRGGVVASSAGGARVTLLDTARGGAIAVGRGGVGRVAATMLGRAGGVSRGVPGSAMASLMSALTAGGRSVGAGGAAAKPTMRAAGGAQSSSAGGARVTVVGTRRGGGVVVGVGGAARASASLLGLGGGVSPAKPGAGVASLPAWLRAGGVSVGSSGAAAKPVMTARAGGVSIARPGAFAHPVATLLAGGISVGVSGGVGRVFAFGLKGVSRDANGTVLPAARVDVYRTSDHVHVGRVTTDATTGAWQVQVPSDPITYWARYLKVLADGTRLFATTDEENLPVETVVQGPAL